METFFNKKNCKVLVCLMIVAVFIATAFVPANYAYAAAGQYSSLSSRVKINNAKYAEANKINKLSLSSYQDIYLTDMFETHEQGMTVKQEAVIKKKADEIIREAQKVKGAALTEYEMLDAFHDWIVENFYYYKDANKLSSESDNPYYLLTTEYSKSKGKIRSRCNGYAATFIAFARAKGITARAVSGHYIPETRKTANNSKWAKVKALSENHTWAEAYADRNGDGTKEWIMVDCNADCWNKYTPDGRYVEEGNYYDRAMYDAVRNVYFDVSAKRLSQSHVIMAYRSGSKQVDYIGCAVGKKKLKAFLEIKHNGKKNGKRINNAYNPNKVETWFAKTDVKSKGDGYGHVYKLYWPSKAGLYGKLDLSGFKSLQNFNVTNNQLTALVLKNCPSLTKVSAANNKLKTVDTRGSKNVTLVSVQGNPATNVSYTFNKNKTAIIKTNGVGGTVSVKYNKVSASKHHHVMTAFAKPGYKFTGWYQGKKCITKNKKIDKNMSKGFTYVAKFKKK